MNSRSLVRYADDFVVLCKTPEKAQEAMKLTEEVLKGLRLNFNKHKTHIVNFDQGFHFLGVQFIRSLAFKSKHKPPQRLIPDISKKKSDDTSPIQATQKKNPQGSFEKPMQWYSYALPANTHYTSSDEMREAFAEAGIVAKEFLSEAEPEIDHFEPPEFSQTEETKENEIPQNNKPRLKTLYLMEHGSTLGKQYERFVIKRKGLIIKEVPAIHIDQIMVFGNSQLTTQVMQFCLQERIPIYLLSGKGRYYGMVDSFNTEPVLLHREQFLQADNKDFCLQLAKQFILGKISNSQLLLKRLSRDRDAPALKKAIPQLKQLLNQLAQAQSLDQLRGFEGNAARIYFQALAATFDKKWGFTKRIKQPPTDPINAMLSYGYTLLFYNMYSFLRARGLNPHVGYLHSMRMGHPALVSDTIEEFRAIVVDSVVLNIVLNNKLTPDDFKWQKGQSCLLNTKARGLFIRHLENKLNAALTHPNSGLKLDYRRCMEQQVNHLAHVIRGHEKQYQPLILR